MGRTSMPLVPTTTKAMTTLTRLLLLFAIGLVPSPVIIHALPTGFVDEGVDRVSGVVDIAFVTTSNSNANTDVLLSITKPGQLYKLNLPDDDNAGSELVLDLSSVVCDNGERGLGAVTVHPRFDETPWIYLFYTFNNGDPSCLLDDTVGPVNRCSRFWVQDDWTIDLDSEQVLFTTPPLSNKIHNGGDMAFGVDGNLYVVTGDDGRRSQQYAQVRSNLFGNVLRLTEDGDIPPGNPYTGVGTARCHVSGETTNDQYCQEIFAYGLRNPFRFTMDPYSTTKVRFLISDVGGKTWEEVNVGGDDFVGSNYGWPIQEGPCTFNSVDDCSIGDSASDYTDPLHWYQHDEEQSGSVVGVAIPPPGLNWPAPYNDPSSVFFVEFVWGFIYHITRDQDQYCDSCTPPRPGFRNETFHAHERPVGLKFGPYNDPLSSNPFGTDMALYYTARRGQQNIRRIVYRGGDNLAPAAMFSVDKKIVEVGEVVVFDASATTDVNHANAELTFLWNFGDSSPEDSSSGAIASHQYNAVGDYQVELRVIDPDGAVGVAFERITVGTPPTVEILSPAIETQFAVGDVFTLTGSGVDNMGDSLDEATQLKWEVRQHHNNHYHPFLAPGTVGNNIVITEAPEPEDFFAAGNSYLEIILTGTDSQGLSTTVSRNVLPKTVLLDFDSDPSGLTVSLDEEVLEMPQRVLSWENHNLRVVVQDQDGYVFDGWSNSASGYQEVFVVPPATTGDFPKYTAYFSRPETPTTVPPTPSPTSAPTMIDYSEFECFSVSNTVIVQGHSKPKPIREVQIGDYVQTSLGFSRVFSLGHVDTTTRAQFLQIFAHGLSAPLEVTPGHMLFVDNSPVRAKDVRVGDKLGTRVVTSIQTIKRRGLFAPVTTSGDIVVSGVLASCFVAPFHHLPPAVQHTAAQTILSPLRLACWVNFEFCKKEQYIDGRPSYLWRIVLGVEDVADYPRALQLFLFGAVAMVLMAIAVVEQMLSCHGLLAAFLAMVLGTVVVERLSRRLPLPFAGRTTKHSTL